MKDYTLWYCGALLLQQILMSTAEDHNTAWVHYSDQLPPVCLFFLFYRVKPPCGIHQYCNMEISSNIYSSFQVSRSFKKMPSPNQ